MILALERGGKAPPVESPWEVVVLVVSWALVTTLCSVVVRWDERRMERLEQEERLERAWPPASRDAALIGLALLGSPLLALFGVFFHFFRTRSGPLWMPWKWSGKGFGLGLGFATAILIANAVVVIGLALVVGLPLD